ncbi:MAG: tetratricopeptide repeat protein [Kofleriaceae bacterium]
MLKWLGALVIMIVHPVAAQPIQVEIPGGAVEAEPSISMTMMPPLPLPSYDEATAGARLAALDSGVAKARDPIAHAQARLLRAAFFAAHARQEERLALTALIGADEAKLAARPPFDAEAKRRTARMEAALDRSIADLLVVACDASDRSRGVGCRPDPALTSWASQDEALIQLAWVLQVAKRDADAAQIFERIVVQHPQSRFAADAAIAVGEQAFSQVDLVRAEKMYTLGLAAQTPETRAFARYKLAWVQFDLGRTAEAFESFAVVATVTGGAPPTRISREARKDLVRAYTGTAAAAHAVFERIAPGQGLELLVRLGQLWFETGKHTEAALIFTEAMRLAPLDPRQCEWQAMITRSAFATLGPPRIAVELERLHGALAKLRTVPTAELATCLDDTRDLTSKLIVQLEREARATRDPTLLDLVDPLYGEMIASFPLDAGRASMRGRRVESAWSRAELERKDPRRFWLIVVARCDEALDAHLEEPAREKELAVVRALARKRAAAPPRA